MARADAILAAVQRIHEAPLTPDGWTCALPSIASALRSEHSIFLAQDASRAAEFVVGFGMSSEQTAGFTAAAGPGSAFWEIIRALPVGSVAPTSALLPDREYARTTFYNEGVRPLGAFHGLLVSPLRTPQRFVHLSTGRRLGRQDFDADDIAALRTLVPHLVTALNVAHKLAAAELRAAGARAALDRLEVSVILVDAAARILFANRSAEAILSGNDGLGVDRDGVRACSRNITRVLHRLIASCADATTINGEPGGSIELPRGEGCRPQHVVVAPFRANAEQIDTAWFGTALPVAILIVTDPERERRMRKEHLRRRFGLTSAEADVALEILEGDGRAASAARLGIAATTVRAHLSHIFEKTGVHRQAELVRLLMQGEHELTNAAGKSRRSGR
ncbi:helix-turn-helix transcriptional regulator [Bradyrhizobium sp. Arg237L]|uniref:helix-turn-helix transcriptional regulator n=1 Tax=Bradyrhizobium sp. Arg237L TaxID=3003352 RepID=UPI00249F0EE1|nr:helix-turn-helix transcriptional regulator [Bradyrhizobium sp. Arg237L]MDI4234587.1 helix-turn-helix transcriptional regulator [Bradyrhizobium sp. Arg237L]